MMNGIQGMMKGWLYGFRELLKLESKERAMT
jgi:hypothetical protein